jgi:hypothetical protein
VPCVRGPGRCRRGGIRAAVRRARAGPGRGTGVPNRDARPVAILDSNDIAALYDPCQMEGAKGISYSRFADEPEQAECRRIYDQRWPGWKFSQETGFQCHLILQNAAALRKAGRALTIAMWAAGYAALASYQGNAFGKQSFAAAWWLPSALGPAGRRRRGWFRAWPYGPRSPAVRCRAPPGRRPRSPLPRCSACPRRCVRTTPRDRDPNRRARCLRPDRHLLSDAGAASWTISRSTVAAPNE